MTKLQAIRWFASEVLREKVVIPRERLDDNWGIVVGICATQPRLMIPKDLDKKDSGDYTFRKDFTQRYSVAKGFASHTLTILHECGHWKTQEQIDIFTYGKRRARCKTSKDYYLMKEERIATDWAIQWLYEPEHRKLAKEFERRYFGYGKSTI
jgi:hypothetical protein